MVLAASLGAIRFLTEPFEPAYMRRALAVTLVLSALAGVVGVVVQLRRLSFLTDALTHTVFPGIAIASVTGRSLFLGALVAGALSAVALTLAARNRHLDQDAFLALLLASLFSVGVIVVSRHRTYATDLSALLFGRVLTVDRAEIVQTSLVAIVAIALLFAIRKELLLRAFDEESAEAMGYSLLGLDLVVNVVVALVVVAAVRAVGTALVVALLITPAATARLVCRRLGPLVAVSVLVGAIGAWLGLVISYDASTHHDVRLAAGATIVVVLTAIFAVVAGIAGVHLHRTRRETIAEHAGTGAVIPVKHLLDIYETGVMRRALLEAVLVGALCGAVGAHVVLRRLPFFTITVAHATFPGIVLASILGVGTLFGGLAFATVLVLAIHVTTGNRDLDTNTAVGVALAGSFGLGVMLQSAQDGFSKDLAAILVGSVLTVDDTAVRTTVAVGTIVIALLALAHKELVFRAFDPQGAAALGYPRVLDLGLLLVVAATVVTTVPAVGTILSVALLSVPALTARLVTRRVGTAMVAGAAYGAASGVLGLTASAEWDYAAGASIALASAALFFVTLAGVTVLRRARRAPRRRARPAAAPA